MRSYYSHPVDVLRKFDPTLSMSALENEEIFGADDLEKIWARIEEVEADFEGQTGNPARAIRVGVPGQPQTYEFQDASLRRVQNGVKIWLDNKEILPFNSAEDDVLEVRVGKDRWKDITDRRGDRWEMDPEDGWVRIFSRLTTNLWSQSMRDRILRCSYRFNALGGRFDRSGETTLDGQVDDTVTNWTVNDPSRLPPRGVLYVGADEYVTLNEIDYETGDLTVTRGTRGTTATSHDDGTTVHYCPTDIRSGIAAQCAVELVMNDDITDNLAVPDDDLSRNDRITNWQDDYKSLLASNAEVRTP